MEKYNGKKEAGSVPKYNKMLMIISVFAVSLFVGMAVQPVFAGPISTSETIKNSQTPDPQCDSCSQAVVFAIEYMIKHVKDNLDGIYFLWSVDATILIFQGLIIGLSKSGFKPTLDEDELKANINYWVKKLVGPQLFTSTKLLANIGAISIGITGYLLKLCKNEPTNTATVNIEPTGRIGRFCPICIFNRIILKLLHI